MSKDDFLGFCISDGDGLTLPLEADVGAQERLAIYYEFFCSQALDCHLGVIVNKQNVIFKEVRWHGVSCNIVR